jgi:penicillin-binding protein 1A
MLNLLFGVLAGLMTIGLIIFAGYSTLALQLPDLNALNDVHYQSPMRVYSRDGLLIGEFGEKIRYPITLDEVPKPMVQAFLSAEDDRFFDHPGFDYQGLLRASLTYLVTGQKRQGGSTITMQVARNFFLSNEKTFLRKIKEIMLAMKIEAELPKTRILELYLNKIYLGNHAYGIKAAAQIYYNKPLEALDLAEIAMIAGLPKAPSTFNPIINPDRAMTRRNYVINRMRELNYIDDAQRKVALEQPNTAKLHAHALDVDLPYIAEIVRNQMFEQFGEEAYNNGFKVKTTVDSKLQLLAEDTLRKSLHQFDERRRFRPIREHAELPKNATIADLDKALLAFPRLGLTQPALVTQIRGGGAEVYWGEGKKTVLSAQELTWANHGLNDASTQENESKTSKPLSVGDILRFRDVEGKLKLTQIPEVGGALVSVDANSGAVISIAGGYDFQYSKFNRAIQSKRQPGSGFKPVIYATALSEGMTPSSIIVDAPISFGSWSPMNSTRRFYGPTPLRQALTHSRNVVAVRLLQKVGINKAIRMATSIGFEPDELPRYLPLALGSGAASPLRMAQLYGVFANGGFRIDPYFIAEVQTDSGRTLYKATPPTACVDCEPTSTPGEGTARRVLTPQVHYMMNSMLRDVVMFGTARKALALNRADVAGKTGTTNKSYDAWFNGYVPGLVTIAWFGYDAYKSLGHNQMGGDLALPMWLKYMEVALKDVPVHEFSVPEEGPDYRRIKVGTKSGTSEPEYEFLLVKKGALSQDLPPRKEATKDDKPAEPDSNDDGDAIPDDTPAPTPPAKERKGNGASRESETVF